MPELASLKFTSSHEWIRVEGDKGIVGITDHAQEEISDVVFVEVPKNGQEVKQGEEVAVVESVKAAFSIYAPVSGTVSSMNEELPKNPGRVNAAPYEAGWIFELTGVDTAQLESLMSLEQYEAFAKGEDKANS
jgi:glycine cleavage system H protein